MILDLVIDGGDFAFHLDHRNIVGSGGVGYNILDITADRVPDLPLEIFQMEGAETMQLHKGAIIRDGKTDCATNRHRYAEIRESWVIYIKEWHTKFHLEHLGQIDKVDLGLEWCAAPIGQPHKTGKDRKILCVQNPVTGAFDVFLLGSVVLGVHEYCNFTVPDPQGRSPADGVLSDSLARGDPGRMPFPNQIGWLIAADLVHQTGRPFVPENAHIPPPSDTFCEYSPKGIAAYTNPFSWIPGLLLGSGSCRNSSKNDKSKIDKYDTCAGSSPLLYFLVNPFFVG